VADSHEDDNEPSGSLRGKKCIDQLNDYQKDFRVFKKVAQQLAL
jgi:hypothetical protein